MTKLAFHEVVKGIERGDLVEGTEFTTSSGFHALFKEGVLRWVTQGGYVGSSVIVSKEAMAEIYTVVEADEYKSISFIEAMHNLAKGNQVIILLEDREYEASNFEDFDKIIMTREYFSDLYKATYSVPAEKKVVELPFSDMPTEAESDPAEDRSFSGKKLSVSDAWEIHHKYHFAKWSVPGLAFQYGVSTRMIYYILDGTHWYEVYKDFHTEYDIVKDDYIK